MTQISVYGVNQEYQSAVGGGVQQAAVVPEAIGQRSVQSQAPEQQGTTSAKALWTTAHVLQELHTNLLPCSVDERATVDCVLVSRKLTVPMAIVEGQYVVLDAHDALQIAAERGLLVDWELVPEVTTIEAAKAWQVRKHPLRRKSSSPAERAARGRAVLALPDGERASPRVLQLLSNLYRVPLEDLLSDAVYARVNVQVASL